MLHRNFIALMLVAASAYGQGSQTPIYNGVLQSDLNAAGYKINAANLSGYAGVGLTWNVVTGKLDSTGGGGGGTPAGNPGDFQYNNSGIFGAYNPLQALNTISAKHTGTNYYWIGNYANASQMAGTADATAAVQTALTQIQTDMLANGGGRYVLDIGDSILRIDGPLQETSGRNAQLLLPKIAIFTDKQCSLIIEGSAPPSVGFSIVGGIPKPTKGGRIKSTLTTGSGTTPSLMATALTSYSIMLLALRNLEIETAPNPVITAVNASQAGMLQMENVMIDTGSYSSTGVTTPTNSGSYGLITPANNNAALTMLHNVVVVGFYTGFQLSEHSYADNITATANLVGAEIPFGYHASNIDRFLLVHNVTGIKSTGGISRLASGQLAIEHSDGSTDSFVTTADVSDIANYLRGYANYAVVLQNTGVSSTFTKTGGATFYCTELGFPTPAVINAATGFTIAGAAASGTILQGNGTNYVASTPAWPATAGTAGNVVTSDGTNWVGGTSPMFIRQNAAYTLVSQTAAQQMFNSISNGRITVTGNTTYRFRCVFALSALSGTNGSFGFALGGSATISGQEWWSVGNKAISGTGGTFASWSTAANTTLMPATLATVGQMVIEGTVRVTTGGTIQPQVSMTVAAAAVVGVGSFFEIWPIGSNTATSFGNWN